MSKSQLEYIRHMLDEAEYLLQASQGINYQKFSGNPTLTRAFARSLEVIGEAAKQVSDEIRLQCPNIEWRKVTGMRDRLIHGYFGVDYGIVWDVVTTKIGLCKQSFKTFCSDW